VKFRIGIVSQDVLFTDRFCEAMQEAYPKELELLVFPTPEKGLRAIRHYPIDLFLVDEDSSLWDRVPETTHVLFLSENKVSETLPRDRGTICKYQSIQDWYELICEICKEAEKDPMSPDLGPVMGREDLNRLCLFTSAAGGVGTSTAAASFAIHVAGHHKKPIYLNFETFSSTPVFFSGSELNTYTFEDLIYCLRSERYEQDAVLKRAICRDGSGVYFIMPSRNAPDMFSLNGEEILKICDWIQKTEEFDVLILDMNFESTENVILPFLQAFRTVVVTDGSATANRKTEDLIRTLPLVSDLSEIEVGKKVRLMYNRYPEENGELILNRGMGKLGGIHELPHKSEHALIRSISMLSPFARLAEEYDV